MHEECKCHTWKTVFIYILYQLNHKKNVSVLKSFCLKTYDFKEE